MNLADPVGLSDKWPGNRAGTGVGGEVPRVAGTLSPDSVLMGPGGNTLSFMPWVCSRPPSNSGPAGW